MRDDIPVSSGIWEVHVFLGRPGSLFQLVPGFLPVEMFVCSHRAWCAGTAASSRAIWPNNDVRLLDMSSVSDVSFVCLHIASLVMCYSIAVGKSTESQSKDSLGYAVSQSATLQGRQYNNSPSSLLWLRNSAMNITSRYNSDSWIFCCRHRTMLTSIVFLWKLLSQQTHHHILSLTFDRAVLWTWLNNLPNERMQRRGYQGSKSR